MPESMRPNVTKVVLGQPFGKDRNSLLVYPYPGHDTAWQKPPVSEYLKTILARGASVVVVLNDGKRLAIKGDMAFYGTDAEFSQLLA